MIKFVNKVNTKILAVSTLIFLVSIIGINILTANVSKTYGTIILDFNLGYTSETVYNILAASGEGGRNAYLWLLSIDLVFPITCALFGWSLLSYLLTKNQIKQKGVFVLAYLPLFGMISDWIENFLIIIMINTFPNDFYILGDISSIFTFLKFFCTMFTLFLALILFISSVIKNARAEKR